MLENVIGFILIGSIFLYAFVQLLISLSKGKKKNIALTAEKARALTLAGKENIKKIVERLYVVPIYKQIIRETEKGKDNLTINLDYVTEVKENAVIDIIQIILSSIEDGDFRITHVENKTYYIDWKNS